MGRPLHWARRACWLLLAALGCSSRGRPSLEASNGGAPAGDGACSIEEHVEVPLALFGEESDPPSLVPFGERFAVIDGESVEPGKTANVALVSWTGVDEQNEFELDELCPDDVCRNVHGTSVLATAASLPEFLLAEQGSAVSMPAYPLRALAWDSDGGPAAITPLFDARVTAITTRADLRSSRHATRAVFALGNIDMPEVQTVEIAEGAALVAPPATLTLPSAAWDCLWVVPTDEAGAISAISKPDGGSDVAWSVWELDAEAKVVFETSVNVSAGDALGYADCPTVLESPEGFHAQWVSSGGASVVATVARAGASGAPPAVLDLDASPGSLAAILPGEFMFLAPLDGEQQGFVRLTRDGEPGGPTITLPALADPTTGPRRALPQVLTVSGSTLDVTYELESTRVFEALSCP